MLKRQLDIFRHKTYYADMHVYIATDHAGFTLKETLVPFIQGLGHEVTDCGAKAYDETDDYPDFIKKAAQEVSLNPTKSRAIILGGSGQGEAIVANRFPHIRAIIYYGGTLDVIVLGREHNDANALSLGARFITEKDARTAVKLFLETPFSNDERHARRIGKLRKL